MDLNLDDNKGSSGIIKRLNSPRTLEAMKILGLDTSELEAVSLDEVKQYFYKRERSSNIPMELIDLRFKTLNQRRFEKKKLIVEQRNKIMRDEEMERGFASSLSHNVASSSIVNPVFNSTARTPNNGIGMFNTLQTKGSQASNGFS